MAAPTILVTGPDIHRTIPQSALLEQTHGDGVAVSSVLLVSELASGVTHCTAIAAEGVYRASVPLDAMVRGGVIIVSTDGILLDESTGGPFRLLVNEGDTLCWNVKNVAELRLTDGPLPDDVPEKPTH